MAQRIPDWSTTTEAQRLSAAATSRKCVETLGRKLNAVATVISETGGRDGPLMGLPYAAKDMIATGLHAGSWGCASSPTSNTPRSSVLKRLDDAGAHLVASSEMTELAYEPSGYNAHRGRVLNPWDFDRIVGGSSSGSAALVASGCCPVALGSDSGGSVRIPAHCCGITALKPTWNRLPLDGTMPLAPSLDTIGLMTRSAADLALVWPHLAAIDRPTPKLSQRLTFLSDALAESQEPIIGALKAATTTFKSIDISVTARAGFPEEADREALLVLQAEAARSHCERGDNERIDPVLRRRLSKGLSITDAELSASLEKRAQLQRAFVELIGNADAALLPVMPISTPRVGEANPTSPEFRASTLYALSRFTRFVNYLGLPALALPAGQDEATGMPIALQLVGRPNDEATLIEIGLRFQAVTAWHSRIPRAVAADIAAQKG